MSISTCPQPSCRLLALWLFAKHQQVCVPATQERTFRRCRFKGLPGRMCDPFTSACNDVQLFQTQGGGVSTYTVRIPFGSRRGSARFRRVAAACRSPGKTHSQSETWDQTDARS